MSKHLCLITALVAAGVGIAQAEPAFQFDPASNRVVSISNLNKDSPCDPRPFRGIIAKRQFDDDRVTVAGFILEFPDGSRQFIGIDLCPKGLHFLIDGARVFEDLSNVNYRHGYSMSGGCSVS